MLSVGLVGLPNAGKSTLFNLITKRSVPAENFPFCTIEPHDGIVYVPDERIGKLANISASIREVYAAIEFKDIAGLVKNAHQGAGLGNQFLSHIREVDLILMIVRCFDNDDIIHVENRVNPFEDEEILLMELTMADQNTLEKLVPRLEKDLKSSKDKLIGEKINLAEELLSAVSELQPASSVTMTSSSDKEMIRWRKSLNLLTDKPILKLGNIVLDGQNKPYLSDFEMDIASEASFADLTGEERLELGMDSNSGLNQMIQKCYDKLSLATYLTTGETETRAWTFEKGSLAPQCAGKIHTDFEKKFIKAEVIKYDDFVSLGGWKEAVANGKMAMVGKDYEMQDGDVVEFKIGG